MLILWSFLIVYLVYCGYSRFFGNKFTLSYAKTPRNFEIIEKLGFAKRNVFKAHFFFPSAFFQTFISSFDTRKLSFQKPIELKSLQFRIPNAETTIDFVYFLKENSNNSEEIQNKKFLMILPGLTGNINDAYIRELCQEAIKNDLQPIVFNNRWLGKPVKLPKIGPLNFLDDLHKTIEFITSKYKIQEIYIIGISYGSNLLCKYLGTLGKDSKLIKGAVSIGNPFNMYRNSKLINGFWNRILCRILQKALVLRKKYYLKTNRKSYNFSQIEEALKANNFIDFDENFTRRMLGFKSTQEYYKKFSCIYDLKNISIPILCLQSKDDPISHFEVTPMHESDKNSNLFFYATEKGGHIGWVEGIFRFKVFYPKLCIQFLKSL